MGMSHFGRFSLLIASFSYARAFTFDFTPLTECGNVNISWTGAASNLYLTILPSFGVPVNVSIPASNNNNGAGTFSTQLAFTKDTPLMLSLSDSTGFGSGGVTEVVTVGAAQGGASCNTTVTSPDFTFGLDGDLTQCGSLLFSIIGPNSVQPLSAFGVIPGGDIISIPASVGGSNSFSWVANIQGGTSVLFFVYDAAGRQGGCSRVLQASPSQNSGCLGSNAASSTSNPPSETSSQSSASGSSSAAPASSSSSSVAPTSSSSSSAAPVSSSSSSHSSLAVGAVAGGAVGGLVVLAFIIFIAIYYMRRRKQNRGRAGQKREDLFGGDKSDGDQPPVSHVYPYPQPTTPYVPEQAHGMAAPGQGTGAFIDNSRSTYYGEYDPYATYASSSAGRPVSLAATSEPGMLPNTYVQVAPTAISSGSSSSGGARQKGAQAGVEAYQMPTRFVRHTDAEDVPREQEEEVVELPPQYTPRRRPVAELEEGEGSPLRAPISPGRDVNAPSSPADDGLHMAP